MPNMVGLGAVQDPLSEVGKQELNPGPKLLDGRQVIEPTPLRPVATPVDKYARPASPPINNNWEMLIQGLSQLNSGLDAYKAKSDAEAKKGNKDAVINAINGKSPDEIHTMLSQPDKYPVFNNAVNAQYGGETLAKVTADNQFQQFQKYWQENGSADMNPVDEWNKLTQRNIQAYGNNKGFASSYFTQAQSYADQLANGYLQTQAQQSQYRQAAQVQGGFASIVRQGVNEGWDDQKVVDQTATYLQLNKNIARLPYAQQVKTLKDAFQPLINDMDSRPELADKYAQAMLAVLETPRKGEDGVDRRLIDAPNGLGDVYKGIQADIEKKRDEIGQRNTTDQIANMEFRAQHDPSSLDDKYIDQWNEAHNFIMKPAQVTALKKTKMDALQKLADQGAVQTAQQMSANDKNDTLQKNVQAIQDGNLFLPKPVDVKQPNYFLKKDQTAVSTYTPEQQKADAIAEIQKNLDFQQNQLVNSKKMTPEQAQQWRHSTELQRFSDAGIVPQSWKDEADAGVNQLTTNAQLASKEMPKGTVDAFHRYKTIAAGAPNLVNQIYDQRARQIFEAAAAMPGSETDNLRAAAMYYANRDEKKDAVIRKNVVSEMQSTTKPGWLGYIFAGQRAPENIGVLNAEAQQRAEYLVGAYHMDPKTAVQKAAEQVAKHYAVVNGYAVSTNDAQLPPNFEKLANKYVHNVVEAAGGPEKLGADSANDITIVPFTDGSYQLFNKKTASPLTNPIPLTSPQGNFDARFLRPEMMSWLSQEDRQKNEIRAVRTNELHQQQQEIAKQDGAAFKQGADYANQKLLKGQGSHTHNPFQPALINKNSVVPPGTIVTQ